MRAIDGDALKRKAQKVATESWKMKTKANIETILNQFIDWIDAAPTIEPERKMAKWIATTSLQEGQIMWRDYKCSNCSHHRGKPMNFCEVCGAKMER